MEKLNERIEDLYHSMARHLNFGTVNSIHFEIPNGSHTVTIRKNFISSIHSKCCSMEFQYNTSI